MNNKTEEQSNKIKHFFQRFSKPLESRGCQLETIIKWNKIKDDNSKATNQTNKLKHIKWNNKVKQAIQNKIKDEKTIKSRVM